MNYEQPTVLYEIEWRELLVKRLKTAQANLKRDVTAERKQRDKAKQLAAGYASYDWVLKIVKLKKDKI